ncbi:MAG TPA: hypothetical protein VGE29_08145 [Prosthecobacter sp.]
MPLVPLFNDGQSVKTPGPAPVPQGRLLRVVMESSRDASGFASPLLPMELADRRGLAYLGRAAQEAAGAMGAIAQKKAEAINIRRVAEAERAMDEETAKFETWKLQNPDETTWEAEWQNRLSAMPDTLFTEGLSPVAREAIQDRYTRFKGQSAVRVATDSAKISFRKAGEELEARAVRAYDAGDVTGGNAAIEEGVKRGMIGGDRGARMSVAGHHHAKALALDDLANGISAALDNPDRTQGLATAKQLIADSGDLLREPERRAKLARIDAVHGVNLEKDQFQEAVLTDPAKAAAELQDATKWPRITGGDRAAALVDAKRMQAQQAGDAYQDAKTRISLGQVAAGEKFEGPGMEQLTPIMRDVLKAMNTEKTRVSSMNNPEEFQRASTAIDAYTPAEGDELARANFEAYLEYGFSGPHLDLLKQQWKEKTENQAETVNTADAFQALDKWAFTDQRMGTFKVPETDKDGRPLQKKTKSFVTTPGWLWGQNEKEVDVMKPVFKEDPAKRDAVAKEVGAIKEKIRREVKKGELPDSAAVWKRMSQLSKMPLAGQAIGEAATSTSGPSSPLFTPSNVPLPDLSSAEKALNIINFKAAK